jgi:hypothetical protein
MYHLAYTSHAVKSLSEAELLDLLKQSRDKNKEFNISGILLYVEGKFMQVLEGKKAFVEKTYASIRKDPRHVRVTLVLGGNSPIRIFEGWSMGFKKLSVEDFANVIGFTDIDTFFNEHQLKENANLLMAILRSFYLKNMVDYPESKSR